MYSVVTAFGDLFDKRTKPEQVFRQALFWYYEHLLYD